MTINDVDVTKVIENEWEIVRGEYNKDGKFTKTTQFLLPAIELSITPKFLTYFLNAFLNDVEYEHVYKRPLFLLFKCTKSKEWAQAYKELKDNKNYRTDYNVGFKDGWDLVMMVYEVPESLHEDYLNFKKGKYSHFSIDYKKRFPRFISTSNKKEEARIWQVIHKSPDLRRSIEHELKIPSSLLDDEDELWDIPRKNTEFYNYDQKSQS